MGFQMSEFEFQTFFLPLPPILENVKNFPVFLIMRPPLREKVLRKKYYFQTACMIHYTKHQHLGSIPVL